MKKVVDEGSKEGADEAQVVKRRKSFLISYCVFGNPDKFLYAHVCVCVVLCVANICLVNCRFVCVNAGCVKNKRKSSSPTH